MMPTKALRKKGKGKGGWNIPWGATKNVKEATAKEESRKARKEKAKMVRKVYQQVPINAKSFLAMVTGVESTHNAWM